jgi:cytochrome oxidase assembly protein ShyY1
MTTTVEHSNVGAVSNTKRVVGGIVFGGLVLGTFSLGTWQIQRYMWKVDKIDHRKEELRSPPLSIESIIEIFRLNNCEKDACARTTSITGRFDHSRSILIGRRGAPDGLVGEKPQGISIHNVTLITYLYTYNLF